MKRVLFILHFLATVVCYGQTTITLPAFPLYTTNWVWPIGTSYKDADTFVLTKAVGGQSGYAYYYYLADLTGPTASFSIDFDFRIDSGADPTDTSDGISFFFLKPGYNYSGSTGEAIGIPNNDTGLVIIFDTHDNDGNNNNPLITMRYLSGVPYIEGSTTGLLAPDIGNKYFICDMSWHHCAINYSSGNITISFDGSPPLMSGYYLINSYGNFGFTGSTGGGYSNQAIRNVSIKAPIKLPCAVALGNDTVICAGDSVVLSSPISSGSTYRWSTGSTDSFITVFNGGTYVLSVTKDSTSCSDSVVVTQELPPTLKLGSDTVLCKGDICVLSYSGATPLVWSNGQRSTSIRVTSSDTYWASLTNECGTARDSVNVNFVQCDLFFPSAFTPNNDNKNDIARVVGNFSLYRDFALSIYNRFGQRVFYTEDINAGWDGKFHGVNADLGTYFYLISYNLEGKNHIMKGDLTLIR